MRQSKVDSRRPGRQRQPLRELETRRVWLIPRGNPPRPKHGIQPCTYVCSVFSPQTSHSSRSTGADFVSPPAGRRTTLNQNSSIDLTMRVSCFMSLGFVMYPLPCIS